MDRLAAAPRSVSRANKDSEIVALAVQDAIKDAARRDLIKFSQYIDGAVAKWYAAEHLQRIARILERVERGELDRVIINIPPRHWKSSISSVKFPAWYLGKHPKCAVIVASYAVTLAEKYSKSVREIVSTNARYKDLFPDVRIRRDSGRMDDWLLETGYHTSFRAVGTGGGIAGHGAQIILLDDVSDPNKQPSATETQNDWDWYKNVIRTRLEPRGAIVVVNNRVGVNDLTGYLLDKARNDSADPPEKWTVINIPAYDKVTDRYLWEERFGIEYYQSLQNDTRLWRVQYQQQPTQEEGDLIKREWFGRKLADDSWEYDIVAKLPNGAAWTVRPLDLAFTEKQVVKHDPDYSATCLMTFFNSIVWLGEPEMWRKDIDATAGRVVAFKMESPGVRLGMGRVAVRSQIIKALNNSGFSIEEFPETTDPVSESTGWRNLAATGRVRLVGTLKEWEPIFEQWFGFPNATHDDAVAMVSIGYQMLGQPLVEHHAPRGNPQRYPKLAATLRGKA